MSVSPSRLELCWFQKAQATKNKFGTYIFTNPSVIFPFDKLFGNVNVCCSYFVGDGKHIWLCLNCAVPTEKKLWNYAGSNVPI